MPPVRWRNGVIIVTTVFLYAFIGYTDANEGMQQPISMTADGWKPIIGTNREPPTHYQKEIKYYQNPILKETVKAEPLPNTTPSTTTIRVKRLEQKNVQTQAIPAAPSSHQVYTKGKIPPHTKHNGQYYVLPNHGGHGPHIPLNAVSHRPVLKKVPLNQHNHPGGLRIVKKPMINQLVTSHSTRNEVFVPAPTSGSYSFYSQGKNVRTRESSGLGIVGQKIYSIKQPHAHVDFSSHFPPSNLYQQLNTPVQHVIFQKQQINEVIPPYQIDSHTNLLPPPIFKNFADHSKYKHNGKINPEIRTPNDKVIFGHNPLGPNDLILQLPSFENSLFGFGKQKIQSQPNVQVTKEKLQSFQNDIPQTFNHQQDQNFYSIRKPITQYPKAPTYEVTEGRWEDNTPPPPPNKLFRPDMQPLELSLPPFLPTPYRPDGVAPTSSTQNEISTIFGQLSNSVKHYPETYTHDPYYFNVKEVSTHFPILNKPELSTTPQPRTETYTNPAFRPSIEEIQTTPDLSKINVEKPKRINQRRRKPMTRYTTTTTESSTEVVTENEEISTTVKENEEAETERPYRSRRPIKNKHAENSSEEDFNRVRNRYRKRPHDNDSRQNHRKRIRPSRYQYEENSTSKPTEPEYKEEVTEVLPIIQHFTTQGFRDFDKDLIDPALPPEPYTKSSVNTDEGFTKIKGYDGSEEGQESEDGGNYGEIKDIRQRKRPNHENPEVTVRHEDVTISNFGEIRYKQRPNYENSQEQSAQHEADSEELMEIRHKQRINYDDNHEVSTSVYDNVYHDEVISTTQETIAYSEEDTLKEIPKKHKRPKIHASKTTELPSTIPNTIPENEVDFTTIKAPEVISLFDTVDISKITTTQEPEPTTTATKSRRRPIKYNASSRPRFSVKDYRNRLNQYSSTTSTETPKSSTSSDNVRIRFPTRQRRPLTTSATATTTTTEETTRTKFVPKEPRHSSPHSINNEVITEKNVRSINTRLRPFGRMKTTTDSATTNTPKVSIKPNLFSNRRRPTPISLKARIQNRNSNKTTEASNKENDFTTETPSSVEENTAVVNDNQISSTNENLTASEKEDTISPPDIMKHDAYMYSQRVSDLTSSMKNDYEGFKAVPSSSRRIPNYYTISTEDPILPIEAFFSNINEKIK